MRWTSSSLDKLADDIQEGDHSVGPDPGIVELAWLGDNHSLCCFPQ